jgi:CRISPR/Cas system CSM-associated protein Csm5 (group 7 of RAMP superfamily)
MDLYETLFETYPFHDEKYGHAQFGWGGGMEHTTVSFMGGFSRGLSA